ncbi:MAG: hypothetical protein KAG20_06505, partial [Cocleimonas sp.]|nr:hypothetical protein [Cocleimonas sp.]
AHGIAVYGMGKNEKKSIHDVIIEGNALSNLRTGSSESIVINGNVIGWEIKNNTVENINNIAIDAIGGEGTSPAHQEKGRILPSSVDVARYGFIEGNVIKNMSTAGNPSYDNEETWAGAIYIDGAHHIKIANNRVENASWAYMLGAENCMTAQHITVTNNSATGSTYGDLYVGGYAKKGYKQDKTINCNPKTSADDHEGHGYVKFITVKNNRLTSKNVNEAVVMVEYRATHAIIAEPTVKAVNTKGNGFAKKDQNAIKNTIKE